MVRNDALHQLHSTLERVHLELPATGAGGSHGTTAAPSAIRRRTLLIERFCHVTC
jgi:hypothetical protein